MPDANVRSLESADDYDDHRRNATSVFGRDLFKGLLRVPRENRFSKTDFKSCFLCAVILYMPASGCFDLVLILLDEFAFYNIKFINDTLVVLSLCVIT